MIEKLTPYLFSLVAALIALTVHEFFHGYVAFKLGDSTARNLGRLSLNPLHHLDLLGVLCMVLFHFGWAKPVPINARNFKNPKRDFALTALAGPLSNIILAFLATPIMLLVSVVYSAFFAKLQSEFCYMLAINTIRFLQYFVILNMGLGIFNLIPLPPFDGSRIINVILPEKWYFAIMRHERKIYLGVIAWLFLGGYLYNGLMMIPFIRNVAPLAYIARFFDLSNLIREAVLALSNLFIEFWGLIIK